MAKCFVCGKEKSNITVISGQSYCSSCLLIIGTKCTTCNKYFISNRNQTICPECVIRTTKPEKAQNGINGCSYKPKPSFFKTSIDKVIDKSDANLLYMGAEIETDTTERVSTSPFCRANRIIGVEHAVNYLYNKYSNHGEKIYFKHDGTCSGFEMIFNPCTLEYYQRVFPMKELLGDIIRCGFVSHDGSRCGLHIHMNKLFFSTINIHKFVNLFNLFKKQMSMFSRRYDSNYAQFINVKRMRYKPKLYTLYEPSVGGKYVSTNVTGNTIEIRSFRGSLKYKTVLATLAMCDAIANYIKQGSHLTLIKTINSMDAEPAWNDVCEYIFTDAWKYIYLIRYMDIHGLFDAKMYELHKKQIDRAIRIIGE